jgi:sodium/bile acid cotransporter 7
VVFNRTHHCDRFNAANSGLAAAYPQFGRKGGTIRSEYSVSYVGLLVFDQVVGIIFLLSGLGMKTRALVQALVYWKLIIYVLVASFVVTPIIGLRCFTKVME